MGKYKLMLGVISALIIFNACTNSKGVEHTREVGIKTYKGMKVLAKDIVINTEFPAVLKGKEEVEIKPRVAGFIEEVYVDEGAIVTKGQALFKINSPTSQKIYEDAKAQFNTAKIDVERIQVLVAKNIISKVQLKTYQNKLESAKASLNQAKESLAWIKVKSPVNGVVGTISYRLGSLVSDQNIITKIASTQKMYANFSMNEKELYTFLDKWEGETKLEKIKNMPPIQFVLSNGKEYKEKGKIETISGVVDPKIGSVKIRAQFQNKADLLISGTSGKVIIPETIKNTLIIPQKATFNRQDKTIVFKVENSIVKEQIIAVKPTSDGKNYVVESGLNSDDVIVVDDIISLRNGQKINTQLK